MRFLILILALSFLWGGSQHLLTTLTNLSPTEIAMAEYIKQSPSKRWLRLTDCQLDLSEATYFSSRFTSEVKEVYIPVTVAGAKDTEKITVLLATKAPKVLGLFNEMNELEEEAEMVAYLVAHEGQMLQQRNIEGLVRFGIELDDDDASMIEGLNPNLSDDFVIIDEGSKPQWILIILFPVGLFLAWLFFFGFKKPSPPPLPPPPLPSKQQPPPLP